MWKSWYDRTQTAKPGSIYETSIHIHRWVVEAVWVAATFWGRCGWPKLVGAVGGGGGEGGVGGEGAGRSGHALPAFKNFLST